MLKQLLTSPMEKFIKIESLSGVLLFAATIVAVVWANSPFGDSYQAIWGYEVGVSMTNFELVKPVILWINDGLMALFFFLIGLEIKRELSVGELNAPKKAIFPLFAAIGGIAFPALVFVLSNNDPEALAGWAIPMATDIAFSLAIMKLLGDRVPLNLKVFLTAFAIVDDLGAVLIIALFYSSGIKWMLILIAFAILGVLFLLTMRGLYSKYLLMVLGVVVWLLFLKAGIHPTIAGVLLAFTVPIHRKVKIPEFMEALDELQEKIIKAPRQENGLLSKAQIEHIDNLDEWTTEVQSPLQRMEHKLHDWVAYVIMPVFALSNAGVTVSTDTALNMNLILGIALALIVGKAVGIFLMSNLALRLGISKLPDGVSRMQILGVSFLAGVGFTMSIFIANLAFKDNPALLDSAKVGILIGSLIAGLTGFLILRALGSPKSDSR
ncbi:Na+/H+ antiporter NhaA [Phaeodactylibacter sp.]|uniref:Na+/H+ antiporter NhaA n=1 Tax=Phaeodactylibacter sp. TaxID=1940289 RepID=UPI0025F83CC0|nr:Na+/H+ antiporter NhaA [Phaeodactylibacter sp.]MCI4647776.1 Na+/H+ antiporter NhaA [Phaeodactylibacter sp.]MCI5094109.1 Na+/H+ antiporter NhaA [Phaeodactylibacter sp.]